MRASDDFNRVESPLAGNWRQVYGLQQAKANGAAAEPLAVPAGHFYDGSFAADQYAQCFVSHVATTGVGVGVIVRASGVSSRNYYLLVTVGTTKLRISKTVNGVATTLGADISVTTVLNRSIKLAVIGGTLTAYLDGLIVGTRTDGSLVSGNPGFLMLDSLANRMDNWQASDILPGSSAVLRAMGAV